MPTKTGFTFDLTSQAYDDITGTVRRAMTDYLRGWQRTRAMQQLADNERSAADWDLHILTLYLDRTDKELRLTSLPESVRVRVIRRLAGTPETFA